MLGANIGTGTSATCHCQRGLASISLMTVQARSRGSVIRAGST